MSSNISRRKAVQELMKVTRPPEAVPVSPMAAIGQTVAVDVAALCDVPEHACSVRDGYAMLAADIKKAKAMTPVRLEVNQCIRAEATDPHPLEPGQAARVLTGGLVPPGADCVLAEEDVEIQDDAILVRTPVRPGWFVRQAGGEIAQGTVITHAGEKLTPQAAAVMTRTRVSAAMVHPRPTARVFALGSELADPAGDGSKTARFPADNLVLTRGLLEQSGAEVIRSGVLPDDQQRLVDALSRTDLPDIVITTGGTGRSERDFARAGAVESGFTILFDSVNIRPGRHVFAAVRDDTLLFGLPGPPAAVYACYHALILPVVRKMRGLTEPAEPVSARFTEGLSAHPGPEWLVQCTLEVHGSTIRATPLTGKDVPPMLGIAKSHGLATLKGGDSILPGGEAELLSIRF